MKIEKKELEKNTIELTIEVSQKELEPFLKKAAKIDKGSSTPGRELVGKVTMKDIEKIAKEKMVDLNAFKVESAMKMVAGTARSMGINVKGAFPS